MKAVNMMNSNNKPQKKKSVVGLCLLLIILIGIALGITYLKFFYKDTTGDPIIPEQKLTPAITSELNKIVDNINNDEIVKGKSKENINIKAELKKDTIAITYNNNNKKEEYNFKYNNMLLEIETESADEVFNEIFKIIVRANQKRLNNTNNIDNIVDQFLNNEYEINGLYKESLEANEITYSISIDKVIKIIETKTEEDDLEG